MKKLLCALALGVAMTGAAWAQTDVSPAMVKQALASGNYAQAEQELNQVIAQHPDSAKAHYVLAQVLAKEGNLQGARQQLDAAAKIDPAIHFTSPDRYNAFRAEIGQAMGELGGHRASTAASYGRPATIAPSEAQHGHGFGLIIGLVILLAVVALIWRAMSRSSQARAPLPPQGFNNGYGANGYGQPPQPPPYGPQGGGRSVMGQVASTAAGVAGGMLAADAIEGMLHHGGEAQAATPPAFGGNGGDNDPLRNIGNSGIDMGNDDSGWGGGGSFDDDSNSW